MDAIHDLVAPSGAFRVLPSSGHLTVLRHHQSPSRVGAAGENWIEWSLVCVYNEDFAHARFLFLLFRASCFQGNGGLDKLIQRFGVQHTGFTHYACLMLYRRAGGWPRTP